MQAYWPLINHWVVAPVVDKQQPTYQALVVNNSWGILHPSLDFPVGHPGRFIDNPNHVFRLFIRALVAAGADITFAASNCPECPTAVCLGRKNQMIMGANAYDEVLTLAGCDVYDQRVGYSSIGPSIANMPQEKPDQTAYTHFLGSKVSRNFVPDSGTSAAAAVAAGCIAALRTRASPQAIPPAVLFQALKQTALKTAGPNWDPGYGYGIIRPVAAARNLALIP
jgi:Subtilase family